MFLCYTSQGVDIVVKWLISLVVTSNHKCLNKIVSNKLALIIFKPRTQPQRWYNYNNLIEQSKKERDRKIQDCGGLRKYQNLIEQKKKDPDLQYTPGKQTLVTHVGEVIAKCRTKVEKLEEAHQGELKIAEGKREKKLQDINKARARRKQTNLEKESGEINIEVTRRDILKVEVEDLKEVIKTLETREGHYRELVNRPNLTTYSKAIYTRKF